ncbi:hypothetical protein [Levilactobacillus cerevisiae]|uniref:hypothetical protein n=1 Tax=Levilactobacillus cerevisiae TaxID=1704076 RepID=UPI000F77F40D|nr:hypothetical protein [Levilactobacillus cerevisiae]
MTKQVRDYWQQFFGDIILLMLLLQIAMTMLAWEDLWAWRILLVSVLGLAIIGICVVSGWHLFWGSSHSVTAAHTTGWLYLLNEHDANLERNWWTWSKGVVVGLGLLMTSVAISDDLLVLPPATDLFLGLDSIVVALGIVSVNVLRWAFSRKRHAVKKV